MHAHIFVLAKASSNEIPLKREHMHACVNLLYHANIIVLISISEYLR
jgi:tRNA splicing endonuclease